MKFFHLFLENLGTHTLVYQMAFAFFVFATIFYFVEKVFLKQVKAIRYFSTGSFILALLCQFIWFFDLWEKAGRAPIRSRYESLVLYSICVAMVYLMIEFFHNVRIVGVFASICCVLILFYATVNKDLEISKLPPALQSLWFVPHVLAYFFSYGALTMAFLMALIFQFKPELTISKEGGFFSPSRGKTVHINYEVASYELIKFGFTFLTWGLILGALWAKFAWGDYWTWDPKENWALITWLIYLTILHIRYIPGFKGRISAAFGILGYLAVMFTYLGIKYLPVAQQSLHVYQG